MCDAGKRIATDDGAPTARSPYFILLKSSDPEPIHLTMLPVEQHRLAEIFFWVHADRVAVNVKEREGFIYVNPVIHYVVPKKIRF